MGCKRKKGKSANRNKGKKMRDLNARVGDKEGSDVEVSVEATSETTVEMAAEAVAETTAEATSEPVLPEQSSLPTEPVSGNSTSDSCDSPPKPEAAEPTAPALEADQPAPEAEPPAAPEVRPASPAAAAPVPVAVDAANATPSEPAPVLTEPSETVSEVIPEPAPSAPAPTPASVGSTGAGINLFNPPFDIPSPPILTFPKPALIKKEEAGDVKEDKLVAARNEENAQVSGLKDDSASDKRNYKPDQWSPHNPDGKKKYDRNFLMDLRNDPQSQKKPDGLPEIEVVIKDGINKKAMQNFSNEFSPAVFSRSSGSRGPPPQRKSQQGKPKPGKSPVVHISLSLREDIKLHETENAWKPGIRAGGKQTTEDEAQNQDLYKRVRGILNKLTPEKFDKLVGQVQELPIDTPDRLKGVIDLVFDKAVDEPNFSVAYAKMCSVLKSKDVQGATFRKVLITRCQHEFEKNKDAENRHRDEEVKKIEEESDPEKKKELKFLYEELERKVRMKSVGNIRFIGELYKLGMLTAAIMLRCVQDLLSKEDEESLECLCKLLSTIGKDLQEELGGQDILGTYFGKMKDLSNKNKRGSNVSSRVRFMLQDCIDLRANQWVPRRDDSNPKTMEEIHREAERETMESNLAMSQPNTPRKDDRMGRMGVMDKRGGRGMTNDDGWKQAPSNRRPLDVNKLTKGMMQQPETATLGSPSQFTKWGGGSGGNSARDPKAMLSSNVVSGNPYAALTAIENKSSMFNNEKRGLSGMPSKDRGMGGGGSRSSSQQRGSQAASRDSSLARGRLDEERRNRVPTPSLTDSSPSDDRPSSETLDGVEGPKCRLKRIEDPDELCKVAKNILVEYLGHKNTEEAALGVMDHFDWTNIVPFTREILTLMLERLQGHQIVSQLLGHLIKTEHMQKQHFIDAFVDILHLCPDLTLDIPKLWIHVGNLIGYILLTETVTFKDLVEPLKVLKGQKEARLLLKHVIDVLGREKGPSWIRDYWNPCGVSWKDFLNVEDVDDFVKENKLDSISGGMQASRSEMTQAEIQRKLHEMLTTEVNFDDVQAWIESNVGERTKEPAFIRALMTAICKNAIYVAEPHNKITLNSDKLRQDKLLLRYVDNKADLELQCLYAVQALVTELEFPQGLIVNVFTVLWEDNLLSTEAFQAWFQSEDPQESDGRGVCKKSLSSFQTMIAEAEDEEDHPLST